jgi:diguanylate cyclase (GGDEF)-like protein/PAS domain S-box-containing protein
VGDRVLTYVSPSSREVLGWAPEELVGQGPEYLVFAEDLPRVAEAATRTEQLRENTPVTVRAHKKDGGFIWIEVNPRLIVDAESGTAVEIIFVMRDITVRKLLEEKLEALAMTDGLTGLANRRAFDEGLQREWRRTLREGRQMSLLLLDIDYFKKFNDVNGHQVGDDCLRAVASAVQRALRSTDIVARYGGEEIAAILPLTDGPGAAYLAERVRAAIEALGMTHAANAEGGGVVTASVGVATAMAMIGGSMRMPESLLQAADHSLYRAKHEGRNRVATRMLIADAGV